MFFGAIPHCLYRDSLTLSDYLSVAFNVHDRTFKRSFIRKNPLTLKLRKQPFRGVILNRCSSSLQINHINLPYETPFLRAHLYGNIQIPPDPFQSNNKKKLGNFILLKDSYDSSAFDSYDPIPTLETVYGK